MELSLGVTLMSVSIIVWSLPPRGLMSMTLLMIVSLFEKTQSMHEGLSGPLARVGKSTNCCRYVSMIASLKLSGSLFSLLSEVL